MGLPHEWFCFLGMYFLICFFHPAALSTAFTNENTTGWLFCKLLCRHEWVRCEQWLFQPPPPVTPARSVLVCVVCSDLRLLKKGLSVGITLLILHGAGRTFDGVWRLFLIFTERSLSRGVVMNGGERFPPHVCISTWTVQFIFPRRVTNVVSKAFLVQRQLCRDGSSFLTLQSSLFCRLSLEDNLSCHSCLASLPWPLWTIKKPRLHTHALMSVCCAYPETYSQGL